MNKNILYALSAAALFGVSTPFAKYLTANLSPVLLAGLLYLGSGVGLSAVRLVRDRGWTPSGMDRAEWPWLLGAIFFGGVLGPVLLLFGLARTLASNASLLLNLEAVLTAVIAWVVFKEHADRRIVLGMVAIVAGGVLLALPDGVGGAENFSTAPFVGAAVSLWLLGEPATAVFWLATALMGLGVWLHLTESHGHEHTHEDLEHEHEHVHDDHHQHTHDAEWNGQQPHRHRHVSVRHSHPHFPDIHHRHTH